MKEIFNMVMQSLTLRYATDEFETVNALKDESTEVECFILGYIHAVKDIYKFVTNKEEINRLYGNGEAETGEHPDVRCEG